MDDVIREMPGTVKLRPDGTVLIKPETIAMLGDEWSVGIARLKARVNITKGSLELEIDREGNNDGLSSNMASDRAG